MALPPSAIEQRLGDAELVRRVIEGHEDALAAAYDRHAAEIYRTALRASRDHSLAEEVVQETFLALWDRAELFDPDRGSLGAWLAAIARHRTIDRLRAAARRRQATPVSALTAPLEDDGPGVDWLVSSGDPVAMGGPEPTPEVALTAGETRAEVGDALALLTEEERLAIMLAYRDGLSQSEIAAHLGWPLGTVKTRTRRALRRLRDALAAAASPSVETEDRPAAVTRSGALRADRSAACCG